MKKKSNLLCVFLTILMCLTMFPASAVGAATVITENTTGTEDGYDYELWKDSGTTSMTLTGGGTFSCEWSNINNALFRKGIKFDCTKTYQEIGNITIDFAADYNPNGNSYLCVYGWTRSPLVEYYIVESWGSWRPPGATSKGTVTIDGGVYDIYETDRIDQPSIDGNTTFKQYWSVRQDKRTSGTISVSSHFAAWESMGMPMGNLYEAALNVEGYQSSGSATITKNTVSVGGDIKGPDNNDNPVEPDENGYYFHSEFEDSTDSWTMRGDDTVKITDSVSYAGNQSLGITGRTDIWNGAARSLSTSAFVPGQSYSFSVMAMQNLTASEDFKLTLQYTKDGEENYDTIAEASGGNGEWVQLANTSYTIPSGASSLLIYVETADSTTSFYIDEAVGAVKGTVISAEKKYSLGDVNLDGKVDASDLIELQDYVLRRTADVNLETSDMNGDGVLDSFDVAGLRKKLANVGQTIDTKDYMESVRASMTANVPASATSESSSVNYGTLKSITYYSSNASKNKKANILLPEGYSENEKYPVLYVNHGIFGDENSMLDDSMKIRTMAGNLAASGEAEKMIIVFTSMFTSKTLDQCTGITLENTQAYDNFLYDLTEDLMPYIEENYSVKTGRENTAIAGFSMGGRESLYIGVMRPDLFGYIGAACPAPGITPGKDSFMDHPGCMQESEFKVKDTANAPYVLMLNGGTNDTVVGTFPQSYHKILTDNGQDHIWQEIQGGGHDASCVVPLMYNFMKNAFKAGKQSPQVPVTPSDNGGVDISWIDPSKPMVAISFDDGAVGTASNSSSMRILNALSDSGFHATFFYVGNWTNSNNQAEVKQAYDMGMEIANHTTSHPYLTNLSESEIRSEYDQCAQKLKSIIGTDPSPLLRLPYLSSNSTVQSALYDAPLITCSIDTQDWNGASSDQIISTIKNAMNNGTLDNSIVLCHETYDSTAEAMEYLCPYLKSQGWQIVTISEMFAVNGKELNGGQIYSKCN